MTRLKAKDWVRVATTLLLSEGEDAQIWGSHFIHSAPIKDGIACRHLPLSKPRYPQLLWRRIGYLDHTSISLFSTCCICFHRNPPANFSAENLLHSNMLLILVLLPPTAAL